MKVPQLNLDAFAGVPFPVATVDELRRKGVLSAEGMGKKIAVVWNDGNPRSYEDSCPHMGLPLSMGRVEGDRLRCRYHGWAFATDDGSLVEQPTLQKPQECGLRRLGTLVAGGLVFAWTGDWGAEEQARAQLPPEVVDDFSLHRVRFACPFYLGLFNAVDYAHFAQHRFYAPVYSLYRRLRNDRHIPGQAFHWELRSEDDHAVHLLLPEARRDLRLYVTCADFRDEDGINQFQTYVTPISATECLYWECYRVRSDNRLARLFARLCFKTVVVHLLDTEDRCWASESAANFLRGENIHLSETDLPLGTHLRKFVLPRSEGEAAGPSEGGVGP